MNRVAELNAPTGVGCSAWLDRIGDLLAKTLHVSPEHVVWIWRHRWRLSAVLKLVGCAGNQRALGVGVLILVAMPQVENARGALSAEIGPNGEHRVAQWNDRLAMKHLGPTVNVLASMRNPALQAAKNCQELILCFAHPIPVIAAAGEDVRPPTEEKANHDADEHLWCGMNQLLTIAGMMIGYLAGWAAYDIRQNVRHWWWRRMRSNDPSSATRRAGRNDCNRDPPAGFAAAHG